MTINDPSIAIVGGTGKEGSAIAARFAKAGVHTIIGSRDAAKAKQFATMVNLECKIESVEGYTNCEAVEKADIVVLAVPYSAMKCTLEEIKPMASGKVIINIASSLDSEKKSRARINPAGSIALEIQNFLGPQTKVVDAFQNICPTDLLDYSGKISTDVLVVGADRATRDMIICLIKKAKILAYDAGPIENAVVVETLTAVLISMNIRYKITGAGIHITGVARDEEPSKE